jgi:hypothetical protein
MLQVAVLQDELLCSGPDLLCSRSDVCRSRADLLRSGCSLVLRSPHFLLRSEVLQAQVLQDAQNQVLQVALPQVELLRSGPDLLCSRSDVRRSLRSDVRCSRGCLLQLV